MARHSLALLASWPLLAGLTASAAGASPTDRAASRAAVSASSPTAVSASTASAPTASAPLAVAAPPIGTAPTEDARSAAAAAAPGVAAEGAPEASAAAADTAGLACTPEQVRRVRLRRRSVVRVQSGGVHGNVFAAAAGVLYPTPRHVVTHRSALGVGRELSVTLVEGELVDARAVGALPGTELVLLELEREAPWPAVELAPGEPEVGAMVLATSLDGQWSMTLHPAGVLARSPRSILVDSEPTRRDGSPLFDCDGRLVGLTGGEHGYTPAGRVRELAQGPRPVEAPSLSWLHATFGVAIHAGDERPWLGAMLGGAVSLHDQLELRLTAAVLGEARAREQQSGQDPQGVRLQLESTVGYRWLVIREVMPTYVVPTVGLTRSWDWDTTRTHGDGVRLSLGARVQMFPLLAVGYSVRPGDARLRDSTHQVFMGLEF